MWWNSGPHLKRRMARERCEVGEREHNSYFRSLTGVEELKEVLRRKYGHITRAWRCAFDEDENGLIDVREFQQALKKISFVGCLRSLWNNLDIDQSGSISLAELDPDAAMALDKFRVRCVAQFGSMQAAWDECLDCNKSGAVSMYEMKAALLELGYSDALEVADLFELLRLTPGAFSIQPHEVLFLQKWEDRKQTSVSRSWRIKARWTNADPYFNEGTTLAEDPKSLSMRRKQAHVHEIRCRAASARSPGMRRPKAASADFSSQAPASARTQWVVRSPEPPTPEPLRPPSRLSPSAPSETRTKPQLSRPVTPMEVGVVDLPDAPLQTPTPFVDGSVHSRPESRSTRGGSAAAEQRPESRSARVGAVTAEQRPESRSGRVGPATAEQRPESRSTRDGSPMAQQRAESRSTWLGPRTPEQRPELPSKMPGSGTAAQRPESRPVRPGSGTAELRLESQSTRPGSSAVEQRPDSQFMHPGSGTAEQRPESRSTRPASRTAEQRPESQPTRPASRTADQRTEWQPMRPGSRAVEQRPESRSTRPGSQASVRADAELDADAQSVSRWSSVVRIDQQKAWEDFRQFLIDRYGSLPRAFDMMDTSGDRYLSKKEFMSLVTRRERYCRACEAARLFEVAVGISEGVNITWKDFGITENEWVLYCHNKQLATQQALVERQMQIKGLREKVALKEHDKRIKRPGKKPEEAFGETLPRGWGFPPTFDPPRARLPAASRS